MSRESRLPYLLWKKRDWKRVKATPTWAGRAGRAGAAGGARRRRWAGAAGARDEPQRALRREGPLPRCCTTMPAVHATLACQPLAGLPRMCCQGRAPRHPTLRSSSCRASTASASARLGAPSRAMACWISAALMADRGGWGGSRSGSLEGKQGVGVRGGRGAGIPVMRTVRGHAGELRARRGAAALRDGRHQSWVPPQGVRPPALWAQPRCPTHPRSGRGRPAARPLPGSST